MDNGIQHMACLVVCGCVVERCGTLVDWTMAAKCGVLKWWCVLDAHKTRAARDEGAQAACSVLCGGDDFTQGMAE